MRLFLIFLILFVKFTAHSEEELSQKALWELGLLGGAVYTPDYPGSNEARLRGLIFPNFRYRGRIFRSDENEGTRVRVVSNPILRADVSFSGNFPVDSSGNEARRGMNDIDAVLEFGPRLKVRLIQGTEFWRPLELVFPLRAVYLTNLRYIEDRGFNFSPGIQYGFKQVFCARCEVFMRLSASIGTERYSDLFYQVEPQYQTPERPFFNAKAGFNALNIFTGYALRIGRVQAFMGVFASNYSGTVNRESPLFRRNSNVRFIFGLGWLFWKSKEQGYL